MTAQQLTCRGCGNQFTFHRRKAYCSRSCRPSLQIKGTDQHANAACRKEHTCKACEIVFKPKRAGFVTFCSRQCSFDWSAAKASCRAVFIRTIRGKPKRIRVEPKVYYQPVTIGVCKNCGTAFDRTRSGSHRYMCSDECRTVSFQRKKRISRKKRKALERGACVGLNVDPFVVFERDGWRCQMCRRMTPKEKRGTYLKLAPELDHIMPLSLGGEHSYRNTQCLCRSCNAEKSNTPMGQLSLL